MRPILDARFTPVVDDRFRAGRYFLFFRERGVSDDLLEEFLYLRRREFLQFFFVLITLHDHRTNSKIFFKRLIPLQFNYGIISPLIHAARVVRCRNLADRARSMLISISWKWRIDRGSER